MLTVLNLHPTVGTAQLDSSVQTAQRLSNLKFKLVLRAITVLERLSPQ